MRRVVAAAGLACALALAHVLAGCSACAPPSSTATLARVTTLDDGTPASFVLSLYMPSHACGDGVCNLCGDPTASIALSFDTAWSAPAGAGNDQHPVVRFSFTPIGPPPDNASTTPASPVDVLLDGVGKTTTTLTAALTCTDGPPCTVGYTLTLARLENAPVGNVKIAWTAQASYASANTPVLVSTP